MSRGPGKVEQAIIDAVAKEPGELIPLWEIAADRGYDITRRNTLHSWRRAAHNLYQQELIEYDWVYGVMCVATPDCDTETARRDTVAIQRAREVEVSRNEALRQQRQTARTEAQFVLDMLDTGRWTVADRKTGRPVDHHATWLNSHH